MNTICRSIAEFTSRKEFCMANNKNLPSKSMKIRTKVVMTSAFFGLFSVVAVHLFKLSVIDNKLYQAKANDQHFGSITISAHRGSIYDAKGATLAKSASVYKVILNPSQFKEDMENLQKRIDKRAEDVKNGTYKSKIEITTNADGVEIETIVDDSLPTSALAFREEALEVLSSKLGISTDEVTKAMEATNQYIILQEKVEKPLADEVLELFNRYELTSLYVEKDTKRYYPQNQLAASVIGFNNSDGVGIYGLEASYNEYLSGTDGRTVSAKDSKGNELPYRYAKTFPAKDGNDVYLTIDQNIQRYLEESLEKMVNDFQIKNRGCAILMNAKSGAIYGMATYPSFDLNNPYDLTDPLDIAELEATKNDEEYTIKQGIFREKQWRNKCISELYEPGSVFKVNTSAAAIEENLVDVNKDSFLCNGFVNMEGHPYPIRCHERNGHGVISYQTALTKSCNPAFMEIGKRLGIEKFLYYYDALGLREPTGIDLPAESAGFQKTIDDMTHVDLAYSAFGQCETITPIEMITSYCAAINGGYLLKPYVVDKVVDADGNIVLKNERTVRRQVYSEETSAIMRNALYHVTTDNGSGNVTIKGYTIGGKSGTSERRSEMNSNSATIAGREEVDTDMEYGASYCCFTPADDPEIILLVLGDMPYNGDARYYGSTVAVPSAREILTQVLPYMGISPEYTDEELAELDVKVPLLEGSVENAKATLEGLGMSEPIVVGEGSTVVAQSPTVGTPVAKDGTVYLYTESSHTVDYTFVPDLSNCTPEYANSLISGAHLNYVARGASVHREGVVVNSQTPEAGEKVAWGSTVVLEFISYGDGD